MTLPLSSDPLHAFILAPALLSICYAFYVYEFCFTSCSKDPHFDLEGREENRERLPFSFKNLLIGDLRASNKPLLPFFAVSFLLISHSSDLSFPPFFSSMYICQMDEESVLPLICCSSIFQKFPHLLLRGCAVVKLQQPRASTLCLPALYFVTQSFPRTGVRNKNHLCTLFTVKSQYFVLHPDDVFGASLSEETLLIPWRILFPGEESLTQYLEN